MAFNRSLRTVLTLQRHLVGSKSPSKISLRSLVSNEVTEREITSHRANVDNTPIHYEQTGIGRQIVLLLPGALGSTRTDFGPQLDNMNKDLLTVIAVDPLGYGKSIPPERSWPDHFLAKDAEDAAKLMQNLNHDKYSLLGWSDGGITAMILAGRYPDRVKKLVVWGCNSYVTEEDQQLLEGVRDIDAWSDKMKAPFIKLYGEDYFRRTWNDWTDAYSNYLFARKGDICEEEIRNIKCPTLIVHGAKDPIVPIVHAHYLNRHIKDSRLHIMPDGKHNLHLRYFKEFNSLVEQFLVE